jgi:3D (Asp-Asp-Asp) domain-containing protein
MLAEGTTVRVMEGPVPDESGVQWLRVTYDRVSGSGWSASDFLVETDEPPAAETPPPARTTAAPTAAPTASTSGRSFVATLSAYAHGSRTASGTPVRWGVVAVDPRVIPLGSKLRIEGFTDTFVAEDTGGFRGNHIDIYFPDRASAIRFGIQRRTVTVLDS